MGYATGNVVGYDTSLGWRYPNERLKQLFPLEGMGETAENLAERYALTRSAQDAFALGSHERALAAWDCWSGRDSGVGARAGAGARAGDGGAPARPF